MMRRKRQNIDKRSERRHRSIWNSGVIGLLGGVGLILVGCSPVSKLASKPQASSSPVVASPSASDIASDIASVTPSAVTPSAQPYTTEAELIGVGDIMMHGSQIQAGYNAATGSYRYDSFFTQVKQILSEGDWVVANLETPLAGATAGYSGYPQFNAPDTLADAIKGAGVNILSTANNHSLDRGEAGVLKTLANIEARALHSVGTAASEEQARRILILEKHQIKMAILAYTYGTNGIPIPAGKDYLVSLIDEPRMIIDILNARQQADVVTVVLHFGTEYQRMPNPEQKRLVANLVRAGADIILGSHPHVVQPYEMLTSVDASGKPKQAVAIYSMGNFISNQRGNYRDLGVIFRVKLRKQFPQGRVELTEVEALPTWVHRYLASGIYQFRVLPLQAVLAAKADPLLGTGDYARLQGDLEQMNQHLKALLPVGETVAVP